MAHLLAAFHVPVNFILRDAEIMLKDAAEPEGGGLLVLCDAEFLAGEIFGFGYAGIEVIRQLGLKQPAARKNRDRDHVRALRLGDQIGRHRHLRHFKLAELELSPKSLGGMGVRRDQLDSLRLDGPVHQRFDALVERGDKS